MNPIFDGPVFTVFTAFDENGHLDLPATLGYVDFLLEHDVPHLYVMPYNSRYLQMTEDEIKSLNRAVISHVKSHSQTQVIVSAPVECSTDITCQFAEEAFGVGVDFFASAFGEKLFTNSQAIDHYGRLADEFGSIIVHEQPLISGFNSKQMNWPMSLMKDVASLSGIVAFKEDTKSVEFGTEILQAELDAEMIFAGRKQLFVPLLTHGLSSYLNGISIVNPKLAQTFWKLAHAGDVAELKRFVAEVDDPFWDGPVKSFGWHRVNKASLQYFGLMSRRDRMPMPHLTDAEYAELCRFWDSHRERIDDWT